jgi:hypothetical protein
MMRRLLVRGWVGGFMLGLLVSALLVSTLLAKPGVVTNKQGETFKGDVTEDEQYVYINTAGGQIRLDKRNVDKIAYTATIDDEYIARHAKLGAKDVKGRIELASWANENQRADLAIAALKEAREIDPTNREAALALDSAEKQMELDQSAAGKGKKNAATEPAATQPTGGGAAAVAPVEPQYEHRLLTMAEVNIIRQKEFATDDDKLRVKFENGLVKQYLAGGDHDAKAFNAMTQAQQADEILRNGDPKTFKDVHILTDPAVLLEYKQKIQPIVAQGCGSTACHGGTKAGNFMLYSGDSPMVVYTNFFILQTYAKTVDGVKHLAMDREVPEQSLVLQFGLPPAVGKPPHPKVAGMRSRFKTSDDPSYQLISAWLGKLRLPVPDYGIKVSAKIPAPATQPADSAPMPPAK